MLAKVILSDSFPLPCFSPSWGLEIERRFMFLCGIGGKGDLISVSHPMNSYWFWLYRGYAGLPLILSGLSGHVVVQANGDHGCGHFPSFTVTLLTRDSVPAPGLWYFACLFSTSLFPQWGHMAISGSTTCYTQAVNSKGAASNSHTQHNTSVSDDLHLAACWTWLGLLLETSRPLQAELVNPAIIPPVLRISCNYCNTSIPFPLWFHSNEDLCMWPLHFPSVSLPIFQRANGDCFSSSFCLAGTYIYIFYFFFFT